MYIYIYTYIHIHIYIYICICSESHAYLAHLLDRLAPETATAKTTTWKRRGCPALLMLEGPVTCKHARPNYVCIYTYM